MSENGWIALLVILVFVLVFWRRIWDFITGLFRPRVTNTALGSFFGGDAGSGHNALSITLAPPVSIQKLFANLTRGDGSFSRGNGICGLGDLVCFRIDYSNTGATAIPADAITIEDHLQGNAQLVPGSVTTNIGDGPDMPLPDNFLGREFRMDEILGATELPGQTTLYIRYRVRVVGNTTATAAPIPPAAAPGPGPD